MKNSTSVVFRHLFLYFPISEVNGREANRMSAAAAAAAAVAVAELF